MPLFSRIATSIQGRVGKLAEENPDGALAKYLWLWQSMGGQPGRRLVPRPIRFFFAALLDLFSLVGWYVRTRILRVAGTVGSKEALMRLCRANQVAVLTIVAGGVIGGLLTFSPLVLRSPADDVAEQVTAEARAEGRLEFKLVLSVTELETRLARIDGQIVSALGLDSIRALGRDEEDPGQEIESLIFGGQNADSAQAEGTEVEEQPEDQTVNIRPFTSLLASGDVEGAYLVATEDVEAAQLFLAIPEVQRILPRNVALHWESVPIALLQRTYRRLYVTEEDAFVTGDMLEAATAQRDPQSDQPQVAFRLNRAGGQRFSNFTTAHIGDYIAIVLDDEILSAPMVQDRIGASGVINMGNADMVEAGDLAALVLRAPR